jgi:hypothetical protein
MGTLAALVPPVIAAAAFIGIAVAIKRLSDREEVEERQQEDRPEPRGD